MPLKISNKQEEYEMLQEILEVAKHDQAKARQILAGLKTAAQFKMSDPLFAKKVQEWERLI